MTNTQELFFLRSYKCLILTPHFGLIDPIFSLHMSLGARWLPPCSCVGYPSDTLICGPIMSLLSLGRLLELFVCLFFSQKMELVSLLRKQVVKVTIEFTSELMPTSPDCLRYYNILFRRFVRRIWFP